MEMLSNNRRRVVLAVAVFAVCYLLGYVVPSFLFPAVSSATRLYANVAMFVASLVAAWFAWSTSRLAPAELLSWVLRGAAIAGTTAFALSALSGPILFATKPNHGLLVGVFVAAPLGAGLGGCAGWIAWSIRRKGAVAMSANRM
jgi:hypothetical protein